MHRLLKMDIANDQKSHSLIKLPPHPHTVMPILNINIPHPAKLHRNAKWVMALVLGRIVITTQTFMRALMSNCEHTNTPSSQYNHSPNILRIVDYTQNLGNLCASFFKIMHAIFCKICAKYACHIYPALYHIVGTQTLK